MNTARIDLASNAPTRCPIGTAWHRCWRDYTLDTIRHPVPSLDEGVSSIAALTTRVAPRWDVGPGDRSVFSGPSPLKTYGHQHTTFSVHDHTVHVDLIVASGSGPGFGLDAALIFVDGDSRGRAWVFGCLGGGGNNFPARARIDERSTITVAYEPGKYGGANLPYIWITVSGTDTEGGGRL